MNEGSASDQGLAIKNVRKVFVLIAALLIPEAALYGQVALDGFDPNANDQVRVVVVQADGKILIGGDFTTLAPNGGAPVTRNRIARLNADGTVDTGFDPNANGDVRSIAVQADGKIVVGGTFGGPNGIGGQARNRIARLDATTGLADSFDPSANNTVRVIVVQADGKILAGGDFFGVNSIGGQTRNYIARLDPTTGLADSFDPNSQEEVDTIALQADGKILAGGEFVMMGGQTRNHVARLNPDGTLDGSFDPNATAAIFTIAVQADNKLLVGGQFASIGGQTRSRIARLDPTTGLADSFNPNANNTVFSIVAQPDGKILAGGVFNGASSIGGQARNRIARLDPTTGLADSSDPNADNEVRSMALQPDGKILAVGRFTTLTPNGGMATRNRIARLTTAIATPTPSATPTGTPVITSPLAATGTVGQPFTYQFEASGAISLAAGNLAPGLTFNAGLRAITGTPTTAGTFQAGLSATNTGGTTNATLTITVQPVPTPGPVIGSGTAVTGRVGQPFRFQVYTTGGSPAARVSASGLPPGLSIDAVTGLILGTPTAAGSSPVTLTVTDGAITTSAILQLTLTADPARPVITSPSSATLTPGLFFSYTITAPTSLGGSEPTIFTLVGTLPAGLTFNAATGTISGIYTGPLRPDLAGGTLLGSIQLFATNSHGTSTFDLLFRAPPKGVVNIATRTTVASGDNILIGGFIVNGDVPKIVIVRAIGPSLNAFLSGALQDPTLELHDSAHPDRVVLNDNWRDTQESIILDSGLQPSDNSESAIVIALDPGSYTAIVRGTNATTGIAVVDVFDLGTANAIGNSGSAQVANIATRGFVNTGDNVMIGGVIIQGQPTRVLIRAIGPALTQFGVPDALANPQLELHDAASTIAQNDDWQTTQIGGIIMSNQVLEIQNSGLAPTNTRESAIIVTLPVGSYTAIVRGANNATGNALVEVYALQ